MSSKNAFLEEHKDFVLKLKIKNENGSNQIRRVRLPRVADADGNVSYDELVGLCITFTFPEGSPENYEVSLTYFDVDEDTVTIASSDELIDAIGQYAEQKVLRLSTEVKPKTKPVGPASRAERGTSTEGLPPLQPQVKSAIDSFVGVLSNAVTTLQEGLATPPTVGNQATPGRVTVTAEAAPGVPAAAARAQSQNRQDQETTQEEEEDQTEVIVPFIHGRHTCDSCLTTPIIGKRYHALNLPDYDLCSRCHGNYRGHEVKFAPVELDRDRAFQARWRRRQEKLARFKNKHASLARGRFAKGVRGRAGRCGARAAEPTGRPTQPCAAPSVAPFDNTIPPPAPTHPPHLPPHVPPPEGCPPPPATTHDSNRDPFGRRCGQPHRPAFDQPHGSAPCANPFWYLNRERNNSGSNDFDAALKEAIRRSLKDIAPTEAELFNENISTSAVEAAVPTPTEDNTESTEATQDSDLSIKEEEKPHEKVVIKTDILAKEPQDVMELEHGGDIEQAMDTSTNEVAALEQAMETASVDSLKLLNEEEDAKPAAVDRENSSATEFFRDQSFQSEAVGSGEVAEAVGATLDLVAGMISEMLTEADSPSKKQQSEKDEDHPAGQQPNRDNTETSQGALILDQTEPAAVEENEWEVVGTDAEKDASQGDDGIARAAEMLGSALFNSEIQGTGEHDTEENVSTLSDSFSVPSSVPSVSVAPTQRSRWSAQLSKLRELGFEDEEQCVEVLERLQAANIGVDSEDEVSVTHVVNAILEQK